jgi:hypothetical protein
MKQLLIALLLVGTAQAQSTININLSPDVRPYADALTELQDYANYTIGAPIEMPEYPTEIMPSPDLLDYNNPDWLNIIESQMIQALVARANRENYWCQVDIGEGIVPCRFGNIKSSDYYVVRFLDELQKEKEKNELALISSLRASVCRNREFYVTEFPDGKPLCVPFNNHQDAENHRFSLANNITNHTLAIDFERRFRGLSGFGIYAWWEDYEFAQNVSCENTIWSNGQVCFRFSDFKTAAIHYWHAREHLRQLEIELERIKGVPSTKSCNDLGWGGDPNNQPRWKPSSETTGQVVFMLPNFYCSSEFGAQGAFGITFKPLATNIRVEDEFGNVLNRGRLRHCGERNNGRLHWDFARASSFQTAPLFVRYEFNGSEECRKVGNANLDLGR